MDYETCLKETGLEEDLPKIDSYVKEFGSYNAMPMRQYLEDWYEGKSKLLLPLFGNRLIIREPIEYTESRSELDIRLAHTFLNTSEWDEEIIIPILRLIEISLFKGESYHSLFNRVLSPFNEEEDTFEAEKVFYRRVYYMFSNSTVFSANRIGIDFLEIEKSEENGLTKNLKFSEESKPFRVITSIVKATEAIARQRDPKTFNDDFFKSLFANIEKYRILHSQCLNSKKLKGTLCLSIHPLDYMTMSDNGYNWTSCMKWHDGGGEYRIGTLEMMNSPSVIIAYLEGEELWYPVSDEWSWSNKKWRQLFIVDRNIISGVKSYPYRSDALTEIVLEKLNTLCQNYGWPAFGEIHSTGDGEMMLDSKNHFFFSTNGMYNDTDCNDFLYRPSSQLDFDRDESRFLMSGGYYDDDENTWELCYSGPVYCLNCGQRLEVNSDSEDDECGLLICDSCSRIMTCNYCGARNHRENMTYYRGDYYCDDCLITCDVCDDIIDAGYLENTTDNTIDFIFRAKSDWNNASYLDNKSLHVCPTCLEKYKEYTMIVDVSDIEDLYIDGEIRVALPTIDPDILLSLKSYPRRTFEDLVDFRDFQKS